MIYFIWLIIIALYWKTYNYHYVIDDYVKRDGYPLPLKEKIDPKFYDTKPTWYYRAFMIGMHCVNSTIISLLWGWEPALLFAVHPMSIWGTAWVTGNYYATTAYFTLIAYFIIHQFPGIVGASAGAAIFWAALNSTYDCMAFPFLFLFNGNWWGLAFFVPLILWLKSARFQAGLKCRSTIANKKKLKMTGWRMSRLALMTKLVAYYIFTWFWPMKVCFFILWGEFNLDFQDIYDELHAWNEQFWISLVLCLGVFGAGCLINFEMTMWFFLFIGLHSQFNMLGQFYAQRYLYLAQVGLCVLVGTALSGHPEAIFFIAGFLAMKTYKAIDSFAHQEYLLLNEVSENPERGDSHSLVAQYYMSKNPINSYPPWMVNRISMFIRRSVILNERSWANWMNLAAFYIFTNRIDDAIAATKKCKELLKDVGADEQAEALKKLDAQIIDYENMNVQFKRDQKQYMKEYLKKK